MFELWRRVKSVWWVQLYMRCDLTPSWYCSLLKIPVRNDLKQRANPGRLRRSAWILPGLDRNLLALSVSWLEQRACVHAAACTMPESQFIRLLEKHHKDPTDASWYKSGTADVLDQRVTALFFVLQIWFPGSAVGIKHLERFGKGIWELKPLSWLLFLLVRDAEGPVRRWEKCRMLR